MSRKICCFSSYFFFYLDFVVAVDSLLGLLIQLADLIVVGFECFAVLVGSVLDVHFSVYVEEYKNSYLSHLHFVFVVDHYCCFAVAAFALMFLSGICISGSSNPDMSQRKVGGCENSVHKS